MMGLTEHQIDLLLRSAERLERLPEVNVHEILEQSVVHAKCCFPKNDPPPVLGIAQPSADPPFLLKTSNAIAKM